MRRIPLRSMQKIWLPVQMIPVVGSGAFLDTNIIKDNLRAYYDREAEHRAAAGKDPWKRECREAFCTLMQREGKRTLLELGAGAGDDSLFFQSCGFVVKAIDLSPEMVRICKGKSIDAYEADYYSLADFEGRFDAVWAMNSLLHVPKPELAQVLQGIHAVLNPGGLFYMGVYGGVDSDTEYVNDIAEVPRFFLITRRCICRMFCANDLQFLTLRSLMLAAMWISSRWLCEGNKGRFVGYAGNHTSSTCH